MLSDDDRVPDVGLNPVRTLAITEALVTVAAAAPGPVAVTSPVRLVIAEPGIEVSVTVPVSSLILKCLSALSTKSVVRPDEGVGIDAAD
jgi:hypothetical protein